MSVLLWLVFGPFVESVPLEEVVASIPTYVALLVAITSSLISLNIFLEHRRTRQAATDPVVVVHFRQRADARELVTLRLSNAGAGAALDVQLETESPNVDLKQYQLLTNVFKRHHPFRVIPQGDSVEFSLAMGFNLFGDKILPPFKARVSYADLDGGTYASEYILDIREMEQLGSQKLIATRQAVATENISKSLERGAHTLSSIFIDVSEIRDHIRRLEPVVKNPSDTE